MKFCRYPTILLLSLATSSAWAGVFFDPYLGASFSQWKMAQRTAVSEYDSRGNSLGATVGARLAWQSGKLFFGVDYNYSFNQWQYNKAGNGSDAQFQDVEATETGWGPILGIRGQVMSLWVSYFPQYEVKMSRNMEPALPEPQYQGTVLGIGVGYQFSNRLKLNLEYKMEKYPKLFIGGSSKDLPATTNGYYQEALERNTYFLSLSIPFGGAAK